MTEIAVGTKLIIAGVCLALGTFGIATSDNATDIFTDMFGAETIDKLNDYFKAVNEAEATSVLLDVHPGLASSAKRLKAQYQIPVEYNPPFYKFYDSNGVPSVSEVLPFAVGTYFFVENLDMYEYYAPTDSYVLTQEAYNDILNAVKSLTKKVVNVGKGVLSWLLDKATANAVDSVASISDAYYDKFGDSYRAAMSSIHGDATTIFVDTYKIGISLHGVLLELHTPSGVYFSTFTAERFETLNNSYAATGDISVFTNTMSTDYQLWDPHGFYGPIDNTNGGVFSGGDAFSTVSLRVDSGVACICTNIKGEAALDKMSDSSKVHIVNNGNTANYVIGTVGADGTISYDVVGEASTYPYIDSIAHGNNKVKVSGDVVLTTKILEQVMDNNLTVEDINSQVAAVSDSVIAIDDSIKNGFESNNNWLSRIWSFLTGLPGLVVGAFASLFDTLFDWLRKILNGILDIPGTIVDGLVSVKDAILDLPGEIAIAAEGMGNFFKGLFDDLLEGLLDILNDILDLLDFLENIFDLLGFLRDILDVLRDIWDFIKSIPSLIIELLKDLLISLFSPKDSFFKDWNDKFHTLLGRKLPYDKYNSFFDDIKSILRYRLDDIKCTIYGQEVTVLSFKWYYMYEDTIDDWIRGVMFLVLVFYNINQMYKLIRGTSLYKIDKYLGK